MKQRVGTDICKISRIEAVLAKTGEAFLKRVLTPAERSQKDWNAKTLARRWALKEAIAKACGTGIGAALSFQDIDISYDGQGAPVVAVIGFHITASVSDDGDYAVAFALAEPV